MFQFLAVILSGLVFTISSCDLLPFKKKSPAGVYVWQHSTQEYIINDTLVVAPAPAPPDNFFTIAQSGIVRFHHSKDSGRTKVLNSAFNGTYQKEGSRIYSQQKLVSFYFSPDFSALRWHQDVYKKIQ